MRIGLTLPPFLRIGGESLELVNVPRAQEPSAELAAIVRKLIDRRARQLAPYLLRYPLPSLYRAGVRYEVEAPRFGIDEEFADPWTVYSRGVGDCDDLSLWRICEGLSRGERLAATVEWMGDYLHCQVRHLDTGEIEDPSARLGMRTTP